MPTKPQSPSVSTTTSQRDMRTPETVTDQHKNARFPTGRPWWGYAEIQTDRRSLPAFVCELMPGDTADPMGSAWDAPWYPIQMREQSGRRYLELNMKRATLTWNYPLMIADAKLATLNYYRAAAKIANANGWKAPGLHEPVSFQIESILLDPPLSQKIPEAAMAGDPWILGFTDAPNPMLAHLLSGVRNRAEEPLVSIDDALKFGEGDDALDARIARAVAKALAEADETRRRSHAEKVRAGKAKAKGTKRGMVAVG